MNIDSTMVCFKCFVANQMSVRQPVIPMEKSVCGCCGKANVDCADSRFLRGAVRIAPGQAEVQR